VLSPSLVLLIDFENVPQSSLGDSTLLRGWLSAIRQAISGSAVGDIHMRFYGGWWDADSVSTARQRAVELIENVPALLSHEGRYWRIRREFADNVLNLPRVGVAVRETYVRRPVESLSLKPEGTALCSRDDCQLKACRAWIFGRRACTQRNCQVRFGDAWHRAEQKQVDVHLATDLLVLAHSPVARHVGIASDDIDFLPAIASAGTADSQLASLSHLRFHRVLTYMDDFLERIGVTIVRAPPS
jgi:hypothetical protein